MADQSGKVGEIYVDVVAKVKLDEASASAARERVQRDLSGRGGGGVGGSALEAAKVRSMAAEARLSSGRLGEQNVFFAAGGNTELSDVQRMGFVTRGTYMKAHSGERVDRAWDAAAFAGQRAQERAEVIAERMEVRQAVRQFRGARREMDAAEKAAMRSDHALESYADPINLNSAVRDAERKGAAAMSAEAKAAAQARRGMGGRLYDMGQTNIMGTGMLMQFMFGGWEAASAIRNGMIGSSAAAGMGPTQALGEQVNLINQLQSGPLGSITGQIVDPFSFRTAALQASARTATLADTNQQAMSGLFEATRFAQFSSRYSGMRGGSSQVGALEITQYKTEAELRESRRAMTRASRDEANARVAEIEMSEVAAARDEAFRAGMNPFNFRGQWRAAKRYWAADDVARDQAAAIQRRQEAVIQAEYEKQAGASKESVAAEMAQTIRDIALRNSAAASEYQRSQLGAEMSYRSATAMGNGVFSLQREAARRDLEIRQNQARRDFGVFAMASPDYALAGMQYGATMANIGRAERDYESAWGERRTQSQIRFLDDQAAWRERTRQTLRETFALQSQGRQLDFAIQAGAGDPFAQLNAQAQGIVDQTLLSLGNQQTPEQRQLRLSNARKQLQVLEQQQINPISTGTPGFFVGGGAPLFNAAGFAAQLNEPQIPGGKQDTPTAAQIQIIIDLLGRFVN